MNIPFRLDRRRALVTGGGSGIGEQIVRVLSAAGAEVIVADINREAAEGLAGELGDGVSALKLDVSDEDGCKQAFGGLERLDYLINNAGIGHVGSIEECELSEWRRLMQVNVDGVFLTSKHALRLLLASDHGAIVNIGSVAGLVGIKRRFAYCATKGATVMITRQMAADYAGRLRVNCICPGTVDTPFVEDYLERYHKHEKEEMRKQLNARQPVGRLGKPEEIAYMALYLCSDEAEFVHGSVQTIDGGWTAL
jgi:NAD(P)-dependent dehydrogenase (short-subunit alcohol dehydrogenase family)